MPIRLKSAFPLCFYSLSAPGVSIGAVITLIGAALFQFLMATVIDEVALEKYARVPA